MSGSIRSLWLEAGAVLPQVELPFDDFAAFAADLDPTDVEKRAPDIYLAAACLNGAPAAHRLLEESVITRLRGAIAAIDPTPDFVDDVLSKSRIHLLQGGENGPARLRSYRAKGSLVAWASVVATRIALQKRRSDQRQANREAKLTESLLDPPNDELEASVLGKVYGPSLERAATAAFEQLAPRQRRVLRMYLVDRLNIDAIAVVYQVHRATVARWIAAARDEVFEKTAHRFFDSQGIQPREFPSISRALVSRMNLDFGELLRSRRVPAEGEEQDS